MILYGLHFLYVLWIDALNIFILIVFPLMLVYKKALEHSDSFLPLGRGQLFLLYGKMYVSFHGKSSRRYADVLLRYWGFLCSGSHRCGTNPLHVWHLPIGIVGGRLASEIR